MAIGWWCLVKNPTQAELNKPTIHITAGQPASSNFAMTLLFSSCLGWLVLCVGLFFFFLIVSSVAQLVPAQSQKNCFHGCGRLLAPVCWHSARVHLEPWVLVTRPGRWQGNWWCLLPGRGMFPSVLSPTRCCSTHPSYPFGPGEQRAATCTPHPCCPGVGWWRDTEWQVIGVAALETLHKGGSLALPQCQPSTRGQPVSLPPQMF